MGISIKKRDGLYYAIDRNKSYTSLLKEMQFIPVFTAFDDFQKYDHHDIEDYTQYLIEAKGASMRNNILFEGKISKVYGYILNKIDLNDIEILYFRRPCRLVESFSKNHIDDLWNFKISDNPFWDEKHKKYIANIIIGKLEKKWNKINTCKVFFNRDEAVYFSYKRDAEGNKQLDENGQEIKLGKVIRLDDSDFIIDPAGNEGTLINYSKSEIYLIQSNKKVKLNEGFVPVKDFIYNLQRYYVYELYDKLVKNGIEPLGVSTDALLVNCHKDDLKNIIAFSKELGGYKLEENKALVNKPIVMKKNTLIDISVENVNEIELNNEFNNTEIEEVLNKHKCLLVKGAYAGVGKTYACSLGIEKNKILYVTPFNLLCQFLQKKGFHAVTLCTFFNLNFRNKKRSTKRKLFDLEGIERIVFDEIYLQI